MKSALLLLISCFGFISYSQDTDKVIERQRIHLHLNKSVFIKGEQIGFTTYLFDLANESPVYQNQYIYVNLIAPSGNQVDQTTVLSINGQGSGVFKLPDSLKSGIFRIQAYTLAMNAYTKDTSFKTSITVLDYENQPITSTDSAKPMFSVYPESGNLVASVLNKVGIKWNRSLDKLAVVDSIVFKNHQNNEHRRIQLNQFGYGNFSYIPLFKGKYSLTAYEYDRFYEIELPEIQEKGTIISSIDNTLKEQFIISVTSNRFDKDTNNKPRYLVIINDLNQVILKKELPYNVYNQEIIIEKKLLNKGAHTINLLTKKNKLLAQRSIFNATKLRNKKLQLLNIKRERDSIFLLLKADIEKNASKKLSVSALPETTIANSKLQSITASLYLNTAIEQKALPILNLLDNPSKRFQYDLDMFMLMEPIKAPKRGKDLLVEPSLSLSTIAGYANIFDAENESLSVMLYCNKNGIFEISPMDENKRFNFANIPLVKNAEFTLTLVDKNGKPLYANFFITTQPRSITFKFPIDSTDFTSKLVKDSTYTNSKLFKRPEQLKEVVVTASKLKRKKFFRDFYGVNVAASQQNKGTLANYLTSQGYGYRFMSPLYPDPRRAGSRELVKIKNGTGFLFPALMVDGVFTPYAMDYADALRMDNIDEIYYRRRDSNDGGLFVVFTKGKSDKPILEKDRVAKKFIVNRGYDIDDYLRPDYYSFENESFKNYGVNAWSPTLQPNEEGIVTLALPDDKQSGVKLFIEGLSEMGNMVSQVLEVDYRKTN
ncbi:hypothetical protein ABN763_14785 [Spongiivirga sp. MCCC 1A20706]|uniref:hypothetical protein n=1 Tax=Spongiivirga sp. MCCC 1A20706 TaxID=3160963 RepID=UPI003977B0FF